MPDEEETEVTNLSDVFSDGGRALLHKSTFLVRRALIGDQIDTCLSDVAFFNALERSLELRLETRSPAPIF